MGTKEKLFRLQRYCFKQKNCKDCPLRDKTICNWSIHLSEGMRKEIESDYEILFGEKHKKLENIMNEFCEKHPLALECGSEYIGQSDEARIDAVEIICAAFDVLLEN